MLGMAQNAALLVAAVRDLDVGARAAGDARAASPGRCSPFGAIDIRSSELPGWRGSGGRTVNSRAKRGTVCQLRAPTMASISGISRATSSEYRSVRQPVASSFWPGRLACPSSSSVSTDSCRAASMKPQVFTTTRSASVGLLDLLVALGRQQLTDAFRVDGVLGAAEADQREARPPGVLQRLYQPATVVPRLHLLPAHGPREALVSLRLLRPARRPRSRRASALVVQR